MLLRDELKAADISTRDRDTGKTKSKDLSNRDLEELPSRSIVSRPETGKLVAAHKTASSDDEVASVLAPLEVGTNLVDPVETVVGCLVQVVTVEGPYLNGFLFLCRVRITGPSVRI